MHQFGIMSQGFQSTIESFISRPPLLVHSSLSQLRYLILSEGLPVESAKNLRRLRCYIWSILSRTSMDNCTNEYIELLKLGAPQSPIYDKIKNDTGRTFQTDQSFKEIVSEEALIRCLSCFAWQTQETESRFEITTYVQGMNILLAPLLYTCPSEPMAFRLFSTLCYSLVPTYITNNLVGVANGAKLLDICLKLIDPKLSKFLGDNLLTAEIYGMPSILTLSSCNKPLDQVCKLWDFMFAYGFHMNILFIIGMLVKIRKKIFKADSPMNLLKDLPEFDANEIIRVGIGFLPKIPSNVYSMLVEHLTNPDLSIS